MCVCGGGGGGGRYRDANSVPTSPLADDITTAPSGPVILHGSIITPMIRKDMFYLTTHSTHFIYGYMASNIW